MPYPIWPRGHGRRARAEALPSLVAESGFEPERGRLMRPLQQPILLAPHRNCPGQSPGPVAERTGVEPVRHFCSPGFKSGAVAIFRLVSPVDQRTSVSVRALVCVRPVRLERTNLAAAGSRPAVFANFTTGASVYGWLPVRVSISVLRIESPAS